MKQKPIAKTPILTPVSESTGPDQDTTDKDQVVLYVDTPEDIFDFIYGRKHGEY